MAARFFLIILTSVYFPSAYAVKAAISYAAFQSPDQAYLELYLRIDGGSVSFVPQPDSAQQAKVNIFVQFFQDDQLISEGQILLSSPISPSPVDFIALERFPLPAGQYDLRLQLVDAHDAENKQKYRALIHLPFEQNEPAQSDINLLARMEISEAPGMLVRNGLLMEPLPYRYYGEDAKQLYFYHEIYHTERFIGQDFVLTYAIESIQNGKSNRIKEIHRRQKAASLIPLHGQIDISQLPSGYYQLAIEIRDAKKKRLSRKTTFFQRSNPGLWQQSEWLLHFDPTHTFVDTMEMDSLAYSIRALNPKLPSADQETINWILKREDRKAQQAYLLAYWSTQAPENPAGAYRAYMEVARAIDRQFHSGFRYGFETDRGYVYLKYGRPTEVEERENEPAAPPYEIWTYDILPATQQNNVRFVFYNPSLAPGDYVLLHSTARGEIQHPQWQRMLYKNAPNDLEGDDYLQGTEVIDNFHRSSRRIFGEGGN